ncbi:hypothetical protein [Natrinema thermotolerans]|nr:hypothetical protein [Natrinema thermotolerans]
MTTPLGATDAVVRADCEGCEWHETVAVDVAIDATGGAPDAR